MTAWTAGSYYRFGFFGTLVALLASAGAIRAQQGVELPPIPLAGEFNGDLRDLPPSEHRTPRLMRRVLKRRAPPYSLRKSPASGELFVGSSLGSRAPMPGPVQNFGGLTNNDNLSGAGGFPADPNGDVGPNHYIEAVNDAFGIYSKTGTLLKTLDENALWSHSSNSTCNGNSQGDPIAIYDRFADRWFLTQFAFGFDDQGNDISPYYECIAVSKSGDPVSGGWWLYAIRMDPGGTGLPPVGTFADYPKFGIWNDGCLYMSANGFNDTDPNNTFFSGAIAVSLNRAEMEAGSTFHYSTVYLNNATDPFTMIPATVLGTALPAAGTPEYFVSESQTDYFIEVRKFTPTANCGGSGRLSAPANVSQTPYKTPDSDIVPQPGTSTMLDSLNDELMQRVQYRKVGNAESLWVVHSVQTSASSTVAPQWMQLDVTGGNVAGTPVQQQIYMPDTTLNRWMGSIAVDQSGNVALGYSTSNGSAPNYPSIAYSGRLATDPLNTLPQSEVQLVAGKSSQTYIDQNGNPTNRWGDYSSMNVDPTDDCTFWYVNMYYASQADGINGNWSTRIASFKYPSCASVTLTKAVMSSPAPGSVLGGSSVTFTWSAGAGATAYWLDVSTVQGVAQGLGNIFAQNIGLATSKTVTGLPVNGAPVYVRLWTMLNSGWQSNDYTYTASTLSGMPAAVQAQPASGSGTSPTNVSFQFSHPAGWQNLDVVNVLVNNFLDGRHACYLAYSNTYTTLYLVDDPGEAGGPYAGSVSLGSSAVIQNSQCAVVLVSAAGSGTTLTLTLTITFKPAFAGNKIFYTAARDLVQDNSNWQALGVWQVPFTAGQISVGTPNPARGTGATANAQAFLFTFNDTKGAGDLGVVDVLINSAINGQRACYVAYSVPFNTLYLVDDAGDAGGPFAGSMPLNGTGSVANGQCQISGPGSAAATAGNLLTLTLNITFKTNFDGNRIFYVAGRDRSDGNNTDWQAVATWTVQ